MHNIEINIGDMKELDIQSGIVAYALHHTIDTG